MKAEELRKMDKEGLMELLEAKKSKVCELRIAFSQVKKEGNVREFRQAKKDLARILTIIKEKGDDRS